MCCVRMCVCVAWLHEQRVPSVPWDVGRTVLTLAGRIAMNAPGGRLPVVSTGSFGKQPS
jgi:hypothetical protein